MAFDKKPINCKLGDLGEARSMYRDLDELETVDLQKYTKKLKMCKNKKDLASTNLLKPF